ncbi:unnamed protein product [Effrenium voratum]|nr:unnamed protein product [Effrenium voratum]
MNEAGEKSARSELRACRRQREAQRWHAKRGPEASQQDKRALFLSEIWASAASLSRGATMQADREAAEAIGGIDPVAGGLVLIHGTASQHRRLRRGELTGLIEDSQADFPTRRRWPFWFNAFVKAQMEPELVLRLAELADWADQAGLRKDTVWGRWKSWIWSWI